MTPAELTAMDPVSVSNHFHKKWHAIFNELINAKEKPIFGKLANHFWRIEYQTRGAPHVHCLLWIEGAPIIGKDSPEKVVEYINTIATCEMPDKLKSPVLHKLVNDHQKHRCNTYCRRKYKKGQNWVTYCRFGFPRPKHDRTILHDILDCLATGRDKKKPRRRIYDLRREEHERYINDYHPALLLTNLSNVDVQYIGHLGSKLPYYVTDYMTKAESAEVDAMWEEVNNAFASLGQKAMSFLLYI